MPAIAFTAPLVTARHETYNAEQPFHLAERLQFRVWHVPAYTMPSNCETTPIQRFVVRHGVNRSLAEGLIADME